MIGLLIYVIDNQISLIIMYINKIKVLGDLYNEKKQRDKNKRLLLKSFDSTDFEVMKSLFM